MINISFVLSTLWLSGGVRDIIEIANRLVERGFEITFVVSGGTVDADIRKEIHPQIEIRESGQTVESAQMGALQKIRLAWSLSRAIPPADIIISTQTPTTVPALLGKLRRRSKLAWFYQDYREMFLDRPIETWLARNAFRWHDAAMVLSEHSRTELLSTNPGPISVVQVGLSHGEYFRPLPAEDRRQSSNGARNILFLGDMRPRKGLQDFLDAMQRVQAAHPDIFLQIVSKDECQIDTPVRHEFIYRPARAELARMFATCDVFVSASWWESFGIPPLEAMACGAPIVMTDSRGGREYARHRENCLLVPPRAPAELAAAVCELLENDHLAEKFRRSGPLMAENFTWERAADRFEKALLELSGP